MSQNVFEDLYGVDELPFVLGGCSWTRATCKGHQPWHLLPPLLTFSLSLTTGFRLSSAAAAILYSVVYVPLDHSAPSLSLRRDLAPRCARPSVAPLAHRPCAPGFCSTELAGFSQSRAGASRLIKHIGSDTSGEEARAPRSIEDSRRRGRHGTLEGGQGDGDGRRDVVSAEAAAVCRAA